MVQNFYLMSMRKNLIDFLKNNTYANSQCKSQSGKFYLSISSLFSPIKILYHMVIFHEFCHVHKITAGIKRLWKTQVMCVCMHVHCQCVHSVLISEYVLMLIVYIGIHCRSSVSIHLCPMILTVIYRVVV